MAFDLSATRASNNILAKIISDSSHEGSPEGMKVCNLFDYLCNITSSGKVVKDIKCPK